MESLGELLREPVKVIEEFFIEEAAYECEESIEIDIRLSAHVSSHRDLDDAPKDEMDRQSGDDAQDGLEINPELPSVTVSSEYQIIQIHVFDACVRTGE